MVNDRQVLSSLAGLVAGLADVVGVGFVSQASRDLSAAGVGPPGVDSGDPGTVVCRPGSAAEVAQVVRLCGAQGARVVPVGTASRRSAPRREERPRVVIDMKRLANVLFLDETSLVVQVQAGLTGISLEELLLPRNLTLGDFPPAALRSTIGGMLSVRTPGKASPRHGFLEDAVLGLSAVLADGRTVHTRVAPRRATGPDLARALCGSEGQLGIITSAVLRIHRRSESRLLDAHRLPSVEAAIEVVMEALKKGAQPAAARIYDAAEAAAHLSGALAAPGADEAILVAATAGPAELAALDRDIVGEAARRRGGSALGPGPAEIWWRRRFGHLVPGPTPPPPALELSASPRALGPVYRAARAAAEAAGRRARAHLSRFHLDGGCWFITLLDGERPDPLGPARPAVEQAAQAAGASLVGARDPAFAPYLAALRAELDPQGIFG